jgi:hypothetical protein
MPCLAVAKQDVWITWLDIKALQQISCGRLRARRSYIKNVTRKKGGGLEAVAAAGRQQQRGRGRQAHVKGGRVTRDSSDGQVCMCFVTAL